MDVSGLPKRWFLICFTNDFRAYVPQTPLKRMQSWRRVPTHLSFICFNTGSGAYDARTLLKRMESWCRVPKHTSFIYFNKVSEACAPHTQLKRMTNWCRMPTLYFCICFNTNSEVPPLQALLKREDYSHGSIGSLKMTLPKPVSFHGGITAKWIPILICFMYMILHDNESGLSDEQHCKVP